MIMMFKLYGYSASNTISQLRTISLATVVG